jgi:hypothetical protein
MTNLTALVLGEAGGGSPCFVVLGLFVAVTLVVHWAWKAPARHIVCPNPKCGYRGPANRKARGSFLAGLILCCFFLLPGLIYFIVRGGYLYSCPECGMQIGSDY